MVFICCGCAGNRPAGGLKQPCRNCGASDVDRVLPLDGFLWFGESPTDEEAAITRALHADKKRIRS